MNFEEYKKEKKRLHRKLGSRLTYFHLIDIVKLVEDIKSSSTYSNDRNITPYFQMIFSKLIQVAEPYTKYLFSSDIGPYQSIFGEPAGNLETSNFILLAQISMFHQCILDGYKDCLDTEFVKKDSDNRIKLTASTVPNIKPGYAYTSQNNLDYSVPLSKGESQSFYGRCTHFLKRKDEFSPQRVNSLRQFIPGQTPYELYALKTECTPLNFLLSEKTVHQFDKQLKEKIITDTFAIKHKSLTDSYYSEKNTLQVEDALLFDMILEPMYGFSFFDSLYKLFKEIDTPSMPLHELTLLKGEAFKLVISKYAAALPICYNKFSFLKYACYAVKNSASLESLYLANPSWGVHYDSATPLSGVDRVSKSLKCLNTYFHLLLFNTIPLIQDLWTVVAEQLEITLEDYQRFIKENYSVITYNYDSLPNNIVPIDGKSVTFETYYRLLIQYINEHSNQEVHSTEKTIFNTNASYYKDICEIIQAHSHYMMTTEHSRFTSSLIRREPDRNAPYHAEQEKFIHNHARNIMEYCLTLD